MLSTIVEALGFAALVLAAYEWSGRVAGLILLGVVFLFVGWVLEGVKLPRKKKPPLKLVDEPLTNRELDEEVG